MKIAFAADFGFEFCPPSIEKLLCIRTEMKLYRSIRGKIREFCENLLHREDCRMVRLPIDIRPCSVHVRPHEDLEALDKSVVARASCQGIPQIIAKPSRLEITDQAKAYVGRVYCTAANAIDRETTVAVPCLEVKSSFTLP